MSPLSSSPRGAGIVGCDNAAGVLAQAETIGSGRSRHATEEGETVTLPAGLTRDRNTQRSEGPASRLDRKRKTGDAEVATGVWQGVWPSVAGRAEGAGDEQDEEMGTKTAAVARRKRPDGSGTATKIEEELRKFA